MPKLDCENNRHPLRDDFSMYYRGTYIQAVVKGELKVMYVRDVALKDDEGDGYDLKGLDFFGDVTGGDGVPKERTRWNASIVDYVVPTMGYRKIGDRFVYFTYQVGNRTQKKGLVIDQLITTPRVDLNSSNIRAFFANEPFEGRISRDLVLKPKGSLGWRGETVGTFIDGNLRLFKPYEHVKELVCKLLERSSEVKTTEIIDQ